MPEPHNPNSKVANRSVYLMLFFIVSLWGVNLVMIKYLVQFLSPFALAAVRIPLAALFLLPLAVMRHGWLNLSPKGWLLTGSIALFSIFLHQLTLSTGLLTTSGTHASLILGLNPLFTTILASYFTQEPFSWNKGLGVVLGLSGVLTIVTHSDNASIATLTGDVIMLVSMLCYVVGSLFVKRSTQIVPTLVVTAYSHTLAGFALLPVAYFSEPIWLIGDIWQIGPIACLFISGGICTGLGAYCWNIGINKVGASIASLFLNLIPLVGVFAFAVIFGEAIGWKQFAALGLVLAGVMLGTGVVVLPGTQHACTETEK